ncbi:hypothetical protein AB205_0046400 [Aquarana catesbeiana]|uniref:Uncharacterized protein n=1 Tax=Aquarana catesbeiana TaxID=8400 RepID=A0A2G9SE91_AQUCT|nr:hypothetical protein AB205_0046400 [Aquarana catesbeiana]
MKLLCRTQIKLIGLFINVLTKDSLNFHLGFTHFFHMKKHVECCYVCLVLNVGYTRGAQYFVVFLLFLFFLLCWKLFKCIFIEN